VITRKWLPMLILASAQFVMLLGAKLGDILGRNRAFAIGLAIYGVGSLTTALSPNSLRHLSGSALRL
jgi:MFS family permease